MTNEISGASLSSNQITLPSGTYYVHASAAALQTDRHKLKLRNTTDGSDTIIGTSEYCASDNTTQTRSFITGRFTIAAQKTFEIQHRGETTANIYGFGSQNNFSVVEVYADVHIWKVA